MSFLSERKAPNKVKELTAQMADEGLAQKLGCAQARAGMVPDTKCRESEGRSPSEILHFCSGSSTEVLREA